MSENGASRDRDRAPEQSRHHQVVIVGAGPAGLGCAAALREFDVEDVVVLDRHEIGASFRRWPQEMRLITPSFTGNAFGLLDLNAIVPATSPAYSLGREHPSGSAYADYLDAVAQYYQLHVEPGIEVRSVDIEDDGSYALNTGGGTLLARHVIWAAGEFQYPELNPFAGADGCLHSAGVGSWRELEGDRFTVIGGHESAADAAVALVKLGKSVTVLARTATWEVDDPDPSLTLSPFTRERLEQAEDTGRVDLVGDADVRSVRADGDGWVVRCSDGREWESRTRPILATGFAGSLGQIEHLIEFDESGLPVVSEEADESTLAPGLFLSGPMLQHRGVKLCFIYKFRLRFAVVANSIAQRLGLETSRAVAARRATGMYLDDLSCCAEACDC